ncbi:hypothetical protein [Leptothoe spongobia]|uniref:Inactive STAND domain-containing protein n=1 Tax=Leptothoe spongobia TAU-MAC 1115 TaxID=1967444 RepID=A0A947GGI3_9CYAN|nr:hypothetical protein [Leptothoe spongobia]MBT9314905.1 hypothetical protein [Leptothoe spongobia TAU-MAC 1115]
MNRHERLEEEIKDLKEKLDRCFEKRLLTEDPVQEVNLEKLENKLEEKIKVKERELDQLSDSPVSKNRNALNLDEGLCEIDFDAAKEIIHGVVDTLTANEGGSALLLMEQCFDLEGRLLLNRLRDILTSTSPGKQIPKEYVVEFSPFITANKMSFLESLGKYFDLSFKDITDPESEKTLDQMTQEILSSIAPSLSSGATILIPLKNWKSLDQVYQADFLDWFVNKFWTSLRQTVLEAMKEYSPRVVFVIMVDAEMTTACQAIDCFYNEQPLNSQKVLKLPLTRWSQADIRSWLGSYSSKLKEKSKRNRLVENIFNGKDEELPIKIRVALETAHAQAIF